MTDKGNFDWVTAHSKCSVGQIFEALRAQVRADIETREALRPKSEGHGHYVFKFSSSNERSFSAILEGHRLRSIVTFSLEQQRIMVRNQNDTEIVSATTTLNDEGECRLRINGQERELWQVRKMALEGLLFGGAEWAT